MQIVEKQKQTELIADKRIQALINRNHKLAIEHKRDLYVDNPEFLVYHWSGEAAAFSPNTGELAADEDKRINLGDHNARVDIGGEYPYVNEMPSKKNGFEYSVGNWAEDYAFFLDHSPAEVYPNERIVGEFHWMLEEARFFSTRKVNGNWAVKHEYSELEESVLPTPALTSVLVLNWDGRVYLKK